MTKVTKLPVFGEPVYKISSNSFSERIKITDASARHSINELQYFAVDAVKVLKMEYEDEEMKHILINADTDSEIRIKVADLDAKEKNSYSIFVDLAEANAVAKRMNEIQKQTCKGILDMVSQVYHEYDNVISALK